MSNDSTKEAMRFLLSDADVVLMTRDKLTPAVSYMKAYVEGCFHTRDIYEQARQQDKARIEELTGLVQELLDVMWESVPSDAHTSRKWINALSKAKQLGFTPSTQ